MPATSEVKVARERLEEAIREIAILFIALSPLDMSVNAENPRALRWLVILLGVGVTLFMSALALERMRRRGVRHG